LREEESVRCERVTDNESGESTEEHDVTSTGRDESDNNINRHFTLNLC